MPVSECVVSMDRVRDQRRSYTHSAASIILQHAMHTHTHTRAPHHAICSANTHSQSHTHADAFSQFSRGRLPGFAGAAPRNRINATTNTTTKQHTHPYKKLATQNSFVCARTRTRTHIRVGTRAHMDGWPATTGPLLLFCACFRINAHIIRMKGGLDATVLRPRTCAKHAETAER